MDPTNLTVSEPQSTLSAHITAGSLPGWEHIPQPCQLELIQTLASLLLRHPKLQRLLESRHEPEQ